MCGRDVVVADERAERPVQAYTSIVAAHNPPRTSFRFVVVAIARDVGMSLGLQ
jgi:hypothetical protein